MDDPTLLALALAAGLGVFGVWTGVLQVRGLRRLAARAHVPSDESAYFRGRHRRRLVIAALLVLIGGLIGTAFLSGMEAQIAAIGNGPPPGRGFVRLWGLYWLWVVFLTFVVIGLALADSWASRRYWAAQYRHIREEHHAKLRRDLAVFRSQKQDRRGRFGGRLGGEP